MICRECEVPLPPKRIAAIRKYSLAPVCIACAEHTPRLRPDDVAGMAVMGETDFSRYEERVQEMYS